MLRTTFLFLFLFVSLSSSSSLLRKSISRRQSEPTNCGAIEGFECKCSTYRVTCTSERAIPQQIKVAQSEAQKYPSVELIFSGAQEQHVYEYTLEPVKQLFKSDADNLEVRIKFEKFTALHLSASAFNRIFPDNVPANTRKSLALEIYNPEVQPNDNVNLFANLQVDSLELYVLYPFRGSFQQLFSGANINYLRLSGGDIKSDVSQPFTGTIGRLELAKQAAQIDVKTFPIYPAHELIINAFYVNDFTSDNPPNYSNLGELRIYSQERIPANAFRQYPKLHTLSISTEKDIDPQALSGLHNLEKLTIKDTKPPLEILNSLPNLKEFETSLEKLGEREQCELVEKLANGQIAVQAIPSGRECTCASAYLDTASGRYPCEALNCEQSSCPAIRNNYDAAARTFKQPPPIKRADGSDALRQREPKVYTSPYQISNQDQAKGQQGGAQHQSSGQEGEQQQQPEGGQQNPNDQDPQHPYHPDPSQPEEQSPGEGDSDNQNENGGNQQEGGNTSEDGSQSDSNQSIDGANVNGTDTTTPPKKGLRWLPIIIIVASVAVVLLIGLIVLIVKKRKSGYNQANTSDPGTSKK